MRDAVEVKERELQAEKMSIQPTRGLGERMIVAFCKEKSLSPTPGRNFLMMQNSINQSWLY